MMVVMVVVLAALVLGGCGTTGLLGPAAGYGQGRTRGAY
jgi:predicted small secreted protein